MMDEPKVDDAESIKELRVTTVSQHLPEDHIPKVIRFIHSVTQVRKAFSLKDHQIFPGDETGIVLDNTLKSTLTEK